MGKMRRLAATGLASALLFGLVACGGDDDDAGKDKTTDIGGDKDGKPEGFSASPSYLKKVVDETDGSSYRFSVMMDMGGLLGGGSSDTPLMTGESNGDVQSMHMDLGAMFAGMSEGLGEGDEDLGELGDAFKFDTVVDGDTMYINAPFFAQMGSVLGGSDPELAEAFEVFGEGWGKVDLKALGDTGGGGSFDTQSMDPTVYLDMLRESGEVEELGTDEIDGVEVSGLAAEVSMADLMALQDVDTSQLGELGDVSELTFPIEVWIDGDDLVRRLSFTFDMEAMAKIAEDEGTSEEDLEGLGLEGMEFGMTMDFTDYGEDIEIEIPEDAQDVTEAFKAMSEMDT